MFSKRNWSRIFPIGTLRRKVAKAIYLLFFDWNQFKKNLKTFFHLWKQDGFRAVFPNTASAENTEINQITIFPGSTLAHKYCIGKGLVIGGAAYNPLGLNSLNMDFTDSMDTKFKKEEIRLCSKALKVKLDRFSKEDLLKIGTVGEPRCLTEEEIEKLKSLGYVK